MRPHRPCEARPDRAKYFAGLLQFGRGSEREAEFQVVTTQSAVQHESFNNSSGEPLRRESIELRQFKIGACSAAKKPPKIR